MVMTFDVDPANKMPAVAEALDSMQDHLSQLRMKPAEANRTMLMFEESLVSLMEYADLEHPQRITVKARRLFGTLTISVTVPGQMFPFSEKVMPLGFALEEEGDGDQARVIRGLVLQSFGSKLKYKHRDGKNTVRIEAQRSPYTFLYQTMSCLLAALEATALSLRDFLVGIVPSNFLQPFLDSNMLQLMFLGVLCGIAVGEIGDYSKPLRDFIEACYELFMKMTGIFTRFIPIAVLCSIWSLMLTTGTDLLLSLLGVLAIVFLGMFVLVCIDGMRLRIAGLSPKHFL